jgi:hypothetical protein
MQDRGASRFAHEFWSMQDRVIAPLKIEPPGQQICDFRTISPHRKRARSKWDCGVARAPTLEQCEQRRRMDGMQL